MTADSLLEIITQILVVAICVVVTAKAIKRPYRGNINIAILFAAFTAAVGLKVAFSGVMSPVELNLLTSLLIMTAPYLQMRLVADFSHVRPGLVSLALAGAVASDLSLLLVPEAQRPGWLTSFYVLYFVGFEVVAGVAFARQARLSAPGVTRRRLSALSWASVLLGLNILLAAAIPVLPEYRAVLTVVMRMFGLGCMLGYFVGFAPPRMLRLAWQAPEFRSFLAKASQRTHLNDTSSIIREVEEGAALATGATSAVIALWDEPKNMLRYRMPGSETMREFRPRQFIAGRAFQDQQPVFSADPA